MAHFMINTNTEIAPFEGWNEAEVKGFARYVGEEVGFYLADLSAKEGGITPYVPTPEAEVEEWDAIWEFSYFKAASAVEAHELQEEYPWVRMGLVQPLFEWHDHYSALTQLIFEHNGVIYSSEDAPSYLIGREDFEG